LRWCEDTHVHVIERDAFSLVISRVDSFELWGPCELETGDGKITVALVGRVAMDETEWNSAAARNGAGGLACRAILARYLQDGVGAFSALNGNFAAFIHDERVNRLYFATDRCGILLAYGAGSLGHASVFCSHPDVLATVIGEEQNLDHVSMAEFLSTGRLTFPYTYYRNIRALDPATVHTFALGQGRGFVEQAQTPFFNFEYWADVDTGEQDLAEELAHSFSAAVQRRSSPRFGTTGVGLSGGLDSRAILCTSRPRENVRAFNLYDQLNTESRTATALAQAAGVELFMIQRDFDHYGNSADLGVRISGGMGNIASNHFLGARKRFSALGINNLLTGCYCDYLLKGLSLNTGERKISRREVIRPFSFEHYHRHFNGRAKQSAQVQDRLCSRFPEFSKPVLADEDWFNVEVKRAFPLAYEGDLAQRVIPQRVMPWFLPICDNEVINTYLKIPPRFKLNNSIFKRMVRLVCDDKVAAVPDSNTGAPLDASMGRYTLHRYLSAIKNRLRQKAAPGIATRGSWPNWEYYLGHSRVIASLWGRENALAVDTFDRLLCQPPLSTPPGQYSGREIEYFLRLFTLKLWLDQRAGVSPASESSETHRIPALSSEKTVPLNHVAP
jgi:asparagine synthase (glutamine-hydrolysing)